MERTKECECDWCGAHEADGPRFKAFAAHKATAYPMHACAGCEARAERFATLTNDGVVGDGPLLTIEADGRPPVSMRDAKAARAYLREAFPQARVPRKRSAVKPSKATKSAPRVRTAAKSTPKRSAAPVETGAVIPFSAEVAFRMSGRELKAATANPALAEIATAELERRKAKRAAA